MVGHWLSKAKITGSNPREAASIHFREQVLPKRLHHCIMEFYKGVRGGDLCLYRAYEFLVKQKKANGVTQWRCRDWKKLNCPAKMETRGEEVIQTPSEHSHATNLAGARAKIVMSHMKEDAEQQLASTRNILGTRLEGVPDPVLAKLPKKSSLERRIRGRRQQATLPLPDPTSRDFEIPEEFQDLILHDSGREDPNRILAFADREVLSSISMEEWFGDGTFDKVPCQFFQLYTLHCHIGFGYPPFIYFLLPNKTRETYEGMFQIVQDNIPGEPSRLLLDYEHEQGAYRAFLQVYRDVETSGCFFHLRLSVHRKVQELGLKQRYEQDIEYAHLVKCITALAFVPTTDVE